MKMRATWVAPMRFDATTEQGLRVVMDSPAGESPGGPSPMETVLAALAGCTGMDVVSILNKMRAPLESMTIDVEAERAAEHPRVFTKIHLRYEVGGGVTREQVERAVSLSLERYCPVTAMLRKSAEITHEIVLAERGVAR
ncbi:MAG: OsmC family protein [Armatimonadota bacterium]|nr:OsmC family protein [Armatimonadota bacterium]MDR7422378.1 OsmC family protein [Armatimonadota bacterium]MDR7454832.1 OsmC family protein [Armatimonadota bacterium]MDR7457788.1 OsmC family protein [Armatimonadota bacterium]MDR7497068.1 OsmC family protein [Armatimonadota bacterium]